MSGVALRAIVYRVLSGGEAGPGVNIVLPILLSSLLLVVLLPKIVSGFDGVAMLSGSSPFDCPCRSKSFSQFAHQAGGPFASDVLEPIEIPLTLGVVVLRTG